MNGPLYGKSVLVTRARKQASDLIQQIETLGGEPIVLPGIEILPVQDPELIDRAIFSLARYDWVVFTSVNGVSSFVERLKALQVPMSELAARKLAVIGPATGDYLTQVCRTPDLVPDRFVAESLLEKFQDLSGQNFLLARADLARKELPIGLRDKGAVVEEVVVYHVARANLTADLDGFREPDVLTFTSASGVRNTYETLRSAGRLDWLSRPIICIGPITATAVQELGYRVTLTAREHTISGLVEAIVELMQMEITHA